MKTKIVESDLANYWFDDFGILYAVAKKNKNRTFEMQKENLDVLKKLTEQLLPSLLIPFKAPKPKMEHPTPKYIF